VAPKKTTKAAPKKVRLSHPYWNISTDEYRIFSTNTFISSPPL
jgi:hypothetical protein